MLVLPVSCSGEEGPSNWHGPALCLPGAAAVTPQPPFLASQVINSKESFTQQSRLLCITQEQANNICFSMSNSKLIYLKAKKDGCKGGTRTLEAASLRRTRGSWRRIACTGAASLDRGHKSWRNSGCRNGEPKCWPLCLALVQLLCYYT